MDAGVITGLSLGTLSIFYHFAHAIQDFPQEFSDPLLQRYAQPLWIESSPGQQTEEIANQTKYQGLDDEQRQAGDV